MAPLERAVNRSDGVFQGDAVLRPRIEWMFHPIATRDRRLARQHSVDEIFDGMFVEELRLTPPSSRRPPRKDEADDEE